MEEAQETECPMHTFRQPSKAECLPIEKHPYGYVQRAAYRQPDLHHEEVVELESPFASVVASGTQVYTFLLLGDQNAGKSTFLHSFCFSDDLNFLELTSYLPILASSFINTRFLADDKTPPRDELPFLDTDIARATILLTLDSFVFFLDEFGLPQEEFPPDTRFVLIQFIEIGGDHLDAMMHATEEGGVHSPEMKDILDRSAAMLMQARKTIYFINAATLLKQQKEQDSYEIDAASMNKLIARMSWLSSILPESHQVLFYLSRMPVHCELDVRAIAEWLHELDRDAGLVPVAVPATGSPEMRIKVILDHLKRLKRWRLDIVDVARAEHLQVDDRVSETEQSVDTNELPLNVDKIVATLVRLMQRGMLLSKREAEFFTFTHILQCWKQDFASKQPDFFRKDDSEVKWMHMDEFAEYLENLEFCELPEPILLQKWKNVAQRLVNSHLAIKRYQETQFSRFRIIAEEEAIPSILERVAPADDNYLEIRFFYFAPLMDILYSYFAKNIPGEFWIDETHEETGSGDNATKHKRLAFLDDSSVQAKVKRAIESLEADLRSHWHALVNPTGEHSEKRSRLFLWLLEEWLHAQLMLSEAQSQKPPELRLPTSASAERVSACLQMLEAASPGSGSALKLAIQPQ